MSLMLTELEEGLLSAVVEDARQLRPELQSGLLAQLDELTAQRPSALVCHFLRQIDLPPPVASFWLSTLAMRSEQVPIVALVPASALERSSVQEFGRQLRLRSLSLRVEGFDSVSTAEAWARAWLEVSARMREQ